MPRALNLNYNNQIRGHDGEQIVPEEYKINSNMISSLIKQNKDFLAKLDEKDRELERLNVLVGSLRGKLIKYTELNKKLQSQISQANSISSPHEAVQAPMVAPLVTSQQQQIPQQERQEVSPDFIHLPRRQGNTDNDHKINEIYDKLEVLTNLIAQQQQKGEKTQQTRQDTRQTPSSNAGSDYVSSITDDDIMISESSELRKLEEQVDHLKRKVLIKSENELRKLSLNQQLAELMEKLTTTGSSKTNSTHPLIYERGSNPHNSTNSANSVNHSTSHCEHCHRQSDGGIKRPVMDIKNALETPTPSRARRDKHIEANGSGCGSNNNAIW